MSKKFRPPLVFCLFFLCMFAMNWPSGVKANSAPGIQDVVELNESDPEKLASFVFGKIRLEPSQQVLRAPKQTLGMASGSQIERMQLLEELLSVSGLQVRWNKAELSESDAVQLWDSEKPKLDQPIETLNGTEAAILNSSLVSLIVLGDAIDSAGLAPGSNDDTVTGDISDLQTLYFLEYLEDNSWKPLLPPELDRAKASDVASNNLSTSLLDTATLKLKVHIDEGGARKSKDLGILKLTADELASEPIGVVHKLENSKLLVAFFRGGRALGWQGVPNSGAIENGSEGNSGGGLFGGIGNALGSISTTIGSAPQSEVRPLKLNLEISFSGSGATTSYEIWNIEEGNSHLKELSHLASKVLAITAHIGATPVELADFEPASDEYSRHSAIAIHYLDALGRQYFSIRDAMPASSYREDLVRYYVEPSVVITSMEVDPDFESITFDVDLAHKGYRLAAKTSAKLNQSGLYFERIFNGALDAAVERAILHPGNWDSGATSFLEAANMGAVGVGALPLERAKVEFSIPGNVANSIAKKSTVVGASSWPASWDQHPITWWIVSSGEGYAYDVNAKGRRNSFNEFGTEMAAVLRTMKPMQRYACTVVLAFANLSGTFSNVVSLYDPATGQLMDTAGDLAGNFNKACGKGRGAIPKIKPGGFKAPPGVGRLGPSGKGFNKTFDLLNRKPWRKNGRTFP